MSHLLFNGFKIACRSACVVWCLLFIAGCITTTAQVGQNSAAKGKILSDQIKLRSIDLKVNAETIDVLINSDKKIEYSAVKQDFPLGVMVYLHNAAISDKFTQPSVSERVVGISSISASYTDEKKSDVAVAIMLNKNLNYQVQEGDKTLNLTFYKSGSAANQRFGESDIFPESESSSQTDITEVSSSSQADAKSGGSILTPQPANYGKRAVVTGIDFHAGDDGESSIVINTSNPIKYEMQRSDGNNELQLSLYNTKIPESHQRQLITTYFNSAVDRIIPIDRAGRDAATSKIHIVLRERVPYHILQENNSLTLFLEPSSVKPMKLEDAGLVAQTSQQKIEPPSSALPKPLGSQTSQIKLGEPLKSSNAKDADTESESDDSMPEDLEADAQIDMQGKIADEDNMSNFFDDNPVYVGEPISLDFYETDIKNVFRILQTVSGENFAVDKDVTGTVTLTLEKPAPWDEILNLILKMNGLGKIQEGSIVRIATTETIKAEAKEKAEIIAAKISEMEMKKAQEPMFTEYIPINYANAEADIKPHIEPILTPGRGTATGSSIGTTSTETSSTGSGTISVDKRTNMLIITDTKKKIEQAKQLIYRLDKVTPQILISARIVEVTKDFSHALGVDWGMTDSTNSPSIYRSDLGGIYGFDIAMNHPVDAAASIGYTFARLAGTPLLLNARLTASEATRDLRVISSPKVLTLDNKEAKITQGVEYPYTETEGTENDKTYNTVFKKIDLSLTVTPQVTSDKRIGMKINIDKKEIVGFTPIRPDGGGGEPFIGTSTANTELLVNDGNTIVIGGIVKSRISEGRAGFPLLSNIPYLGQIFRSDNKSDKRNELLIFITPTIVQLDQKKNAL
ncbi:MAG: type IV pilus secretin PilQ [Desulfamplus sp.]|nr:type IV pilus secretin PilQ [Desulfamplus sp.]